MDDLTDRLLLWEHGNPTAFKAIWFSPGAAEYIGPAHRGEVTRLQEADRLVRLGSAVEVFDLDLYYPASVYRVTAGPSAHLTVLTTHDTRLG